MFCLSKSAHTVVVFSVQSTQFRHVLAELQVADPHENPSQTFAAVATQCRERLSELMKQNDGLSLELDELREQYVRPRRSLVRYQTLSTVKDAFVMDVCRLAASQAH